MLTTIPQPETIATAPKTSQPRTRLDRLDQPLDQHPHFLLGRELFRRR